MKRLNLAIFPGGLSWPVYIAKDKGFFSQGGLDVRITEITDSVAQMNGLIAGTYDLVMTPFDNVVAYQEGQGEVPVAHDPGLFAFMGGISSSLRLLATREVNSFEELKGATLGVDAEHTGYTLAMYELLAMHGVPPESYSLSKTGGTSRRVEALAEGAIVATMVSSPQEIIPEQNGFHRLGDVQTMIGSYQAVCGVACRPWAAQAGDDLRAFIKAYVAASDWLGEPVHTEEACQIFVRKIPKATTELAKAAWQLMVGGMEGFQHQARIDPAGAETVLRIRSKYGVPYKDLADWRKYYDGSFYLAAPLKI